MLEPKLKELKGIIFALGRTESHEGKQDVLEYTAFLIDECIKDVEDEDDL